MFHMRQIFNHVNSENFGLVGVSAVPFGYELVNGNIVHQTAQINWDRVDIGVGNRIGPFCIIGGEAQHRYYSSCMIIDRRSQYFPRTCFSEFAHKNLKKHKN